MQSIPVDHYVATFDQRDRMQVASVGGKGASLAELTRIEGIAVPDGFCVTTEAFTRAVAGVAELDESLGRLAMLEPGDLDAVRTVSAEVRRAVEATAIPDDVARAIVAALSRFGAGTAYAVRSSATAEDLPNASFAGQHDTYLNVVGPTAVLDSVRRCWASLFTARAVAYRRRTGIDDRAAGMAVVVQPMVAADAAGVLFTADPVTSNRRVVTLEATAGLGDALVSGAVTPDVYTVRDGAVVATARRPEPVLTDAQVVRLAEVGRRIEAHLGCPQDVEWCVAGDGVWIVQSRPITTLFPIPAITGAGPDDPPRGDANRVYVSVGHGQMMTEAMTPLGLSVWQLTTPRPMAEAGGRLFVDVTLALSAPASRDVLLATFGRSDPLMADAMRQVAERDGFLPSVPDDAPGPLPVGGGPPAATVPDASLVTELMARTQSSITALRHDLARKAGVALLDAVLGDFVELRRLLFDPQSHEMIMAGMEAAWWLNEHLDRWLGEQNAADVLSRSVPHNVTAEMGLALLDVADAIRPHPDVVAYLREVGSDDFLAALMELDGGASARHAIEAWLATYGMRCVGEIDIARPRWSEQPSALLPLVLGNVDRFAPGEARRRFERGRAEAAAERVALLARLQELPGGEQKAMETSRMIDRVRTFAGFREYPKYGMISRYFVYKRALLAEADRLVRAGVLRAADDVYFLRFDELHDVVRTRRADHDLVRRRREDFETYRTLTPPRVITSDGETVAGSYRRDGAPEGALVGVPVSAGTVEGRARVIRDMADADVAVGDILVTTSTDPSWSPLFVAVRALVTEVGGQMTHGAVIAREYGLPAVVGVVDATTRIRDGQQIRVDGTHGHVELLDAAGEPAGASAAAATTRPGC